MAENQNNNVEFTSNKDQHLKRSLKARHMFEGLASHLSQRSKATSWLATPV